jgi:hypothetical protein
LFWIYARLSVRAWLSNCGPACLGKGALYANTRSVELEAAMSKRREANLEKKRIAFRIENK